MAARFKSKDWNASAYDDVMRQRTLDARKFKLTHISGTPPHQASEHDYRV